MQDLTKVANGLGKHYLRRLICKVRAIIVIDMKSSGPSMQFARRHTAEQIEEGFDLAPKFDATGLIPVVTSDARTGEMLMHGYMNEEALRRTIETGEAHYYSRSRQVLWHKGETSGLVQNVVDEHRPGSAASLEDIMDADAWARRRALELAKA